MEKSAKSDIFGGIVLIVTILFSVFWIFNDTYSLILPIIALFIGFSTILYVKRVLAIELEFRNPLADSLIVLAGISSTLNLLSGWIGTFNSMISGIFSSFNFWISISMFVAGILIKIFLLDRVLMESLRQMGVSIKYLVNWSRGGFNNFIRLMMMIIGLLSYLFRNEIDSILHILDAKTIMLASFSIVLILSSNREWKSSIEYFGIRLFTIIVAIVYLIEGLQFDSVNFELIFNFVFWFSAIVWAVSFPTLYSYSRSIITYVPRLFNSLQNLIRNTIKWISTNKLLFSKIILFVVSIVVFVTPTFYEIPVIDISANLIIGTLLLIFIFSDQIIWALKLLIEGIQKLFGDIKHIVHDIIGWINLNQKLAVQLMLGIASLLSYLLITDSVIDVINLKLNVLIALILLFLAILPTIIDFLRLIYPHIVHLFKLIRRYLTNPSKMFFTLAVASTIIPEFIPNLPQYVSVRVGLYVVAGILYAISWQNLMIFVDRLHMIIYKFLSIFTKIFRFITQFLSWRAYVSFSAWIVMFIAIFLRSWVVVNSYTVYIQLALALVAFLLWIAPYPHRRVNLRNFILKLFGRVFKLIRYLLEILIENIILVALWIIAGVFMITGIGLFLPEPFEITKVIFGGILDNLMVSIILGIFLIGLSILTIRESYRNRKKFHWEVIR